MSTSKSEDREKSRRELDETMDSLLTACGLKTVVLVTRDGSMVNARGDSSYFDVTALSALLGGMFSATREVARMVGEEHFSILLQQGEKRHIHISLVPEHFMLAAIFEDVGKIGVIRMHTRRVSPALERLAAEGWRPAQSEPPTAESKHQSTEFREYALDLIDRIFAE